MSKPIVAIPGGASAGLGQALVKALLERGTHTPVVLTRHSSKIPQWLDDSGVEVRRCDYLDTDSVSQALHGVHTVVVTLMASDGTWDTIQQNLLTAGLKNGIKRFVPSEFGIGPEATPQVDLLAAQLPIVDSCRAAVKAHPGFEWTAFHIGSFTNYMGLGNPREPAPPQGGVMVFDVANMKAELPVSSLEAKMPRTTFTTIADTGKFVAAACDLPPGSWEEDTYAVGQTLSYDEVIAAIEKVRGGKMEIKKVTFAEYDEMIERCDLNTEEGFMGRFWMQLLKVAGSDKEKWMVMPSDLDGKVDVKPMTVEEYLESIWGA